MEDNNKYITDLFQEEMEKHNEKEKKKIEKFKRKEEKKKKRQEKKLEKLEDKAFAKKQKMSREIKYSHTDMISKISLENIYKLSILITLFITLSYFLYSLIKRQIYIFNAILLTLIIFGFLLTSTIQKKKERKFISIITSILFILWMLLHL